jgi:hypothetical protein
MPLPEPRAERVRIHQRRVNIDGYKRADGLWEVEATMVDTKDQDYPLSSGLLKAGDAVHAMRVRVAFDAQLTIAEAAACTDAAPYPGACERVAPDYSRIVGLNLMQGFLRAVKEMFGGTQGCTHISELMMLLPTAALQTLAGEVLDNDDSGHRPFQLERCHALAAHSETVRLYYPRWFRKQAPVRIQVANP